VTHRVLPESASSAGRHAHFAQSRMHDIMQRIGPTLAGRSAPVCYFSSVAVAFDGLYCGVWWDLLEVESVEMEVNKERNLLCAGEANEKRLEGDHKEE